MYFFKAIVSSLCTPAMASTPDNRTTRPVSAPVMSPLSPGEAAPSPFLPTLRRSDCHDSSTPKDRRSADRRAEGKAQSQTAQYTKSHGPRPESTPEIKVVDTVLYINTADLGSSCSLHHWTMRRFGYNQRWREVKVGRLIMEWLRLKDSSNSCNITSTSILLTKLSTKKDYRARTYT